jgi:23S rRNA pseudouridine2605 synthase
MTACFPVLVSPPSPRLSLSPRHPLSASPRPAAMDKIRLHKAIATAGIASRRAAEEMIREGRVAVNGEVVTAMGIMVDPSSDTITVDGSALEKGLKRRSYALYKPIGVICTRKDPEGRKTVYDLLPSEVGEGLHTAGRLDIDAEGLLVITNDGDLTLKLTHPSKHLPKTYIVKVKGEVDKAVLKKLRMGVELDDGVTQPADVTVLRGTGTDRNTWLKIVLTEGRKNQIKRMGEAVGHRVLKIKRVAIGSLRLSEHMKPGEIRKLTVGEVERLKSGRGEGGRRGDAEKGRRPSTR